MKKIILITLTVFTVVCCTEETDKYELNDNNSMEQNVLVHPPQDTFLIMSYNIFEGAGTSEGAANVRKNNGCEPNSLNEIIELIKFYNPDIIGLQEAVRWEANNDSIAKLISDTLKMNYILAPGWFPEWNVLLLTKFEIIDYKLYSSFFRIGALKARLNYKNKDTLTVFNFHLSAPEHEKDVQAFNNLTNEFEKTPLGVAMGDFNEPPSNVNFPSNWRLVATAYNIDQIWTTKNIGLSDSENYYGVKIAIDSKKFELNKMSDHLPVLIKTGLYYD
jgi:endonuclease/exonuclease/phosphatase family metal-dependent hydrolase